MANQLIPIPDLAPPSVKHLPIGKRVGVSQIVVSRFLSGERDIRMATADELADALGLRLGAGT
jgi:hypothetical protein